MGAGRPKKEFDTKQFERMLEIFCTKSDVAHVLGLCEKTIDNKIKEHYGEDETFSTLSDRFYAVGRCSLRRWQFELAEKLDRGMLIWLGKNHLGQSDKVETKMSEEDRKNIVNQFRGLKEEFTSELEQ